MKRALLLPDDASIRYEMPSAESSEHADADVDADADNVSGFGSRRRTQVTRTRRARCPGKPPCTTLQGSALAIEFAMRVLYSYP